MTHKLHAKTLLLIVLVAVLTLTLAAAIFFSVDWQKKAVAEETIVLPGNTATYAFLNDMTTVNVNGYDTRYTYDRDTNTWTSPQKYSYASRPIILTLEILTDGDVEFNWKLQRSVDRNAKLIFTVMSGDEEKQISEIVPTTGENKEYKNVKITELKAGDKVKIQWTQGTTSSTEYGIVIQGLLVPTEQFAITVNIAEGYEEYATVNTSDDRDDTSSFPFTVKRGYDECINFDVTPIEGYEAYWTDNNGKIVNRTTDLLIESVNEEYIDVNYTLNFVSTSSITVGNLLGEEQSSEIGWVADSDNDGFYKINNISTATGGSQNKKSFTVEFYGDKYLSFQYESVMSDSSRGNVFIAGMIVDGATSVFSGLNSTYRGSTAPESSTLATVYCHIEGDYYHRIEFTYYRSNAGSYDFEKMTVGNFILSDQPQKYEDIRIKYKPKLSDLYVNGELQSAPEQVDPQTGIAEVVINVAYATVIHIEARPKESVISSVTGQPTTVYTGSSVDFLTSSTIMDYYNDSNYGNNQVVKGEYPFKANSQSVNLIIRNDGIDKKYAISTYTVENDENTFYGLDEGQTEAIITFDYMEALPLPDVTVTRSVDGYADSITIGEENTVEFEFGHTNSATVRIKKYDSISKENYAVTVNGVPIEQFKLNGVSFVLGEYEGDYGFVIKDVVDMKISVSFSMENYYSGNAVVTFVLHVTSSATLNDIIKSDMVTVTNDTKIPWYFSSNFSDSDEYAFMAGPSIYGLSERKGGISTIMFEVSGNDRGMFTFEFKLDGTFMDASEVSDGWSKVGAQLLLSPESFPALYDEITLGKETFDKLQPGGWEQMVGEKAVLLAYSHGSQLGSIVTDQSVTKLNNGWFRAKFVVEPGMRNIYLGFACTAVNLLGGTTADQYLAIRNVNFATGSSTATISLADGGTGTFNATWDNDVREKQTETVTFGDLTIGDIIQLKANVPDGKQFYGWTVNGDFYSASQEIIVDIESSALTIICNIFDENSFEARISGKFYKKFLGEDGALKSAAGNDVIVILDNITIDQSIEIPKGISLVIPYSTDGNYYDNGTLDKYYPAGQMDSSKVQQQIAWATPELESQFKYLTIDIPSNVTITVYGNFYVGGILYTRDQYPQGHNSGAFSHLVNEGKIIVENDGVFDVYGRVTGDGTITVNNGGKVYEPFYILDYAGGSNSLGFFMAEPSQTPFKRYAAINIENTMTVNYGGQFVGHAGLWALGMLVTLDQPFISTYALGDGLGRQTMIMLKENASVTVTYTPDNYVDGENASNGTQLIGKTKLSFTGGAIFSYMMFSAMGMDVPTSGVAFPLPYNFEIVMDGDGSEYEVNTDFRILPGAVVRVMKGATLTLNANVDVMDGLVQSEMSGKNYPTSQQLAAAGYSTCGNLIVDGTLIIAQKWKPDKTGNGSPNPNDKTPASFLGVVQTNGTGRIEIDSTAILTGTIIDGAMAGYNCNYTEFESSARVWDAAHQTIAKLQAGRTYVAQSNETWILPESTNQYDTGAKHSGNVDAHTLETGIIPEVKDMLGAWAVEHVDGQHVLDWTYNAETDTLPSADKKYTTIDRQCQELGCSHTESRELLLVPEDWGSTVFTGDNITEDSIKQVINALFGEDYDLFTAAGGTLSHSPFKDVNEAGYDITITLSNGYWFADGAYSTSELSKTLKFHVTPVTLSAETIEVEGNEDVTYDGTAHEPTVKLTYNGHELALNTDYNVSYSNNKDAGVATVHITAVGNNFTGEFDVHFTINERDITDDAQIEGLEASYDYTGSAQKPAITVKLGGKTLGDSDYTVTYSSDTDGDACTAVGNVTVTVTGKTNYKGSVTATFDIVAKDASAAKVTVEGDYTYTGSAQTPEQGNVKVELADYTLVYGTDYTFVAADNTNVTKQAKVTVTFKGNFSGSAQGIFEIAAKNIAELEFAGVDGSYVYTGKAVKPQPTAQFGGAELEQGKDFGVTYASDKDGEACIAVGKVTVTVTGQGNYTGTKELSCQILPKDASEAQIDVTGSYIYNAEQQSVKLTVSLPGYTITVSDYNVNYGESDRTNAGEVNFTVEFVGNFSGSKQLSFTIDKAAVSVKPDDKTSPQGEVQVELTFTISGTMYGDDKQTLEKGLTCKLDKEFDSSEVGNTFTISVTLSEEARQTLSKNYDIDLTATATYEITDAVFKNVKVGDRIDVTYDGKEHEIEVSGQPEGAETVITYTLKGQPVEGKPKDVGEYSVTVSITLNDYKPYSVKRTINITPQALTVSINKQTVTYSGIEQRPDSGASNWSVTGAVQGESFSLTLTAVLTDVGKTDIVAQLVAGANTKVSNYNYNEESLTLKEGFEVVAKDIAELSFGDVETSYEFTGKSIQPQPDVKFGEIVLAKDKDFTVEFGANVNVADGGQVTINGTGNYTGTKSLSFAITPKDASSATVQVTGSYVYTGSEHSVSFNVTLEGFTVTNDDYTVSYTTSDRTNAGTVQFTVNYKGNYSGSKQASFVIAPKSASLTVDEVKFTFDRTEHNAASAHYTFADLVEGDESGITVTFAGTGTDVGRYDVTATFGGDKAKNYNITVNGSEKLVIEAATIDSVEVTSTHVYNGQPQTPTLVVKAGALILTSEEFSISYNGNLTNAGSVTVRVSAKGSNFTGNGETTFDITKAAVSVTVNDQHSTYGDNFVTEFTFEAEGVLQGDEASVKVADFLTITCNASEQKNANTYAITATVNNQPANYEITVVKQGTYTVEARKVTVTVADQSDTWAYGKSNYVWNAEGWSLTDGTLAPQEQNSDLAITLTKPSIVNAGSYAIVARSDNSNYNVTFVGSWNGEQNSNTAGTYTVAKAQITDGENDVHFVLNVGDDEFNEQQPNVTINGTELALSAYVTVMEDGFRTLSATVDPDSLTASGIVTVTVTVNDINYQGSKVFTVVVIDENGYTPNLYAVLQALNDLVGDVTADTLTSSEEHFALVKGIKEQIDTLSDAEKELGADELAKYSAIVEAWSNGADVDPDVVATAKTIADAPINWLFAAGALNALLAAMFVLKRGGIR